jgi:outer membrane protein assembly factor BamC
MTQSQIAPVALRAIALACAAGLTACTSTSSLFSGSKVDYRSESVKTPELDLPPDLTQLARDARYRPQSGTISASTLTERPGVVAATAGTTGATVALNAADGVRIERQGNHRWLVAAQTPEQLWPVLQNFWRENGFALAVDNAPAGFMETTWAENRAKLPQDIIRRTLGRVLDNMYDTGTRDRFRTRLERTSAGTEIYILHSGAIEQFTGTSRDNTVWRTGANDPHLEAEFLSRLLVKLGNREGAATLAAVAAAAPKAQTPTPAVPATSAAAATPALTSGATSLDINDGFERAFRRVGLALDRTGFTVVDRDRSAGLYFVRYVPGVPGGEEPGFLARLFSSKDAAPPVRYRVQVKAAGENKSQLTVQNSQGQPETGEVAKQIVALVANDLR